MSDDETEPELKRLSSCEPLDEHDEPDEHDESPMNMPIVPYRHGSSVRNRGVRSDEYLDDFIACNAFYICESRGVYSRPTTVVEDNGFQSQRCVNEICIWNYHRFSAIVALLEEHFITKSIKTFSSMAFPDHTIITYTLPVTGVSYFDTRKTRKAFHLGGLSQPKLTTSVVSLPATVRHRKRQRPFVLYGPTRLYINTMYMRTGGGSFVRAPSITYVDRPHETSVKFAVRVVGAKCDIYPVSRYMRYNSYYNSNAADKSTGVARSITLDCGSDVLLTSISTMGASVPVMYFPTPTERHELHIRGNTCIDYINASDNARGGVRKYSISVRQNHGQWTDLGEFNGNISGGSEVTHALDIGFPVRFVKLIPISYFGKSTSMCIGLFKSGVPGKKEHPITLKYEVTIHSTRRFMTKGNKTHRQHYNKSSFLRRREKMKNLRSEIRRAIAQQRD